MPGMEPFELAAGRLLLRPWRDDDLPAVVAALQDPEIALWNSGGGTSADEVAAMLRRRQDWSAGDHASLAVVDAAGGRLLGSVSLHSIDREQADAEIGYWTVPAARGRGVAAAAVVAVCGWAFPALGLDRVELLHAVENTASGRVAAKAGFVLEGRLRRSYRYGDGVKHDELLWSRLADDPPPDAC
jgi:RimJ/RimL family protein N-acetyltransferase